jgi:hypothetical protein
VSFIPPISPWEKVPEAYLMNIGKKMYIVVKRYMKNKKKCVKGKVSKGIMIYSGPTKDTIRQRYIFQY